MKKLLLVALVLGSACSAAGQTPNGEPQAASECKLKLSQAPVIRGISLGMNANQVLALFPGSEKNETLIRRLSEPRFGLITADVVPSYYGSKEKFEGVRSVTFGFLDGELNFFALMYSGPVWESDDQFAAKVAESLDLPAGKKFWRVSVGGKTLACDGFEVLARMPTENSGPMIEIRNLEKDVNRIVRERDQAVKDKARRAFKP